jgi:hypothetical protein
MDWGEPIFSYTCEQAVEDGVLVHPYPQRWPWLLITSKIHEICSRDNGRTYDQALVPLLNDCIMAIKGKSPSALLDEMPLVLHNTVAGTVWIMPNDRGGMTVMNPEDY